MLEYLAKVIGSIGIGSRRRDDNRGATITNQGGDSSVSVNSPSIQAEWGASDWSKILTVDVPCTDCNNGKLLPLPYFPEGTRGVFEIIYKCSNAHCDFSINLLPGRIHHGGKII